MANTHIRWRRGDRLGVVASLLIFTSLAAWSISDQLYGLAITFLAMFAVLALKFWNSRRRGL